VNPVGKAPDKIEIFKHIFIVTGVFLLPGLQIAVLGWLYGLVPLLVFYYLCRYGSNAGGKYILYGALVALLAGTFLQITSQVLLAMTLVPTGFILARSVVQEEAPPLAGLKGFAVLSISWFLMSAMLALTEGNHLYSMLLLSINQGMDEALKLYQENEKIPPESLYLLTQAFAQIKERLSQLMPAILANIALFTVWLTMVVGNRLVSKNTDRSPWPEYQYWQLPDTLVWSVIVAAVLALLPVPMFRTTGFNLLLVVSVIYCFQGLSIVLFFLNKWKAPLFIRSLLYMIIIFQSLGTLFLSVIGLADVWFDFRHRSGQDSNQKKTL
jgi:uncharacterized protein YybS (DUF2232 family)